MKLHCIRLHVPQWPMWKEREQCTLKERMQANLRTIKEDEVILDFEDHLSAHVAIGRLKEEGHAFTAWTTGSRGIHIHLTFPELPYYRAEHRNEFRKQFIQKYNADISKSSESTAIAMEHKPHFKTGGLKKQIDAFAGTNVLGDWKPSAIVYTDQSSVSIADEITKQYLSVLKEVILGSPGGRNGKLFKNIAILLAKLDDNTVNSYIMEVDGHFPGRNTERELRAWVRWARRVPRTFNAVEVDQCMSKFISG